MESLLSGTLWGPGGVQKGGKAPTGAVCGWGGPEHVFQPQEVAHGMGAEIHEAGGGVGGNVGRLGFYVWRPLSVSLLRDLP